MKNPKPWLWLLVASLALNVFLAATVGPHFFRGPPKGPPRPEHMILDMASRLSEADARILRQALDAHRDQLASTGPSPDGPEAMHRALAAEPFDVEAFRQASSEFRANREKENAVITDILAEALPHMSPEGRRQLSLRPPRPPK